MVWKIGDKYLSSEEFKEEFIKIFRPRKYRKWFINSNVFDRLEADTLDNLILEYNNKVK